MDGDIFEQPLTAESLQQILTFFKKNGLTESEEALSREAATVLRLSKDGVDGDTNKHVLFCFFLLVRFLLTTNYDKIRRCSVKL
ncbi:hypothetical protein WUBG_16953 [Wuchereria bancrofti]|uniref:Uncharacterized protein n=1 Tax=Wuchereria bancrofti TaxID=6293 RepID=J9E5B3_WUCBA|nr:hypothetical protein WUBG_16953 [Wuchereria bancrofti]